MNRCSVTASPTSCQTYLLVRGRSRGYRSGAVRTLLLGLLALLALLAGCSRTPEPPRLSEYPVPVQSRIPANLELPAAPGDVQLKPRASYQLTAHVMGVQKYRFDDLADVVPYDFALAWSDAATPEVMRQLSVRQSGRWYYWRASAESMKSLPPSGTLNRSMANTHMVPGTEAAAKALSRVRPGDSIRAQGYLVDLLGPTPRLSRATSLSRTDSGAGACEIFYVTDLEIL